MVLPDMVGLTIAVHNGRQAVEAVGRRQYDLAVEMYIEALRYFAADYSEAERLYRRSIEIEQATGGRDNFIKRPNFTPSICPLSPLILPDNSCKVIINCARSGLGVLVLPMALSGGTSSATLAGTLVTHNTEVLSGIILAQLTKKGVPCTYGSTSTILDLRFGTSAIGSPEYGMINASIAKLAQYYRLPCYVGGGGSDSKIPDTQCGYEFTLSATLSALAGGNIVFGAGVMEQGLTIDFAKLVMDAEMIRMIQVAIGGIEISDDKLAMDVIHEVGPGGAYISHEHSLRSMRSQSRSKCDSAQRPPV